MGLFNKRYLCFICFAFILTAFILTFYGASVKIAVAIIGALALTVSAVFLFKTKKHKFAALFTMFVCLSVVLSSFSSYLFISRAISKAETLVGKNTVLVKIVSQGGYGEYNVRLLRVGEKEVDIKSELTLDAEEKLEYGDRLIMNADVELSNNKQDRSILLDVIYDGNSQIYIDKAEIKNYFSYDGVMSLCHSLQDKFSIHVDKTFGDHSALAKGLLVNDTSDIDAKTKTDFKRSGTSHILAVSGMHIALLMGAVEILLRKLEVKKGIRIVVISILSIFFLALTAFVASAVRSVLMLFAVYLCYILYEENDSITALFASITIIILFSPFSVYDLGMWMSFLATLGILTVYPYFDEKMPYPKQENLFVRYSLRLLVWVAKTLMLTVIANLFLIPIMWYFFGAVSISTLPCNLILTPIVTVLMPLCALSTVLGFVPYISVPFVFVTNKLFDLMMYIVRYFSEVRFGVVSLNYEFAGALITVFVALLSLMLIIKLKHKGLIFAPMIAFVLAFAVCISVFNLNSKPYVQCIESGDSEFIFVNCGSECSIVDSGGYDSAKATMMVKFMSKYATEIDEYFITDPDEKDAHVIEKVCKNTVVRRLYLPKTVSNNDLSLYYKILKCAEKYNISVELYESADSVKICNGVTFSYNHSNDFLIESETVKLEKQNENIFCTYQGETFTVGYDSGFSKKIPLN